jgi:hypothetical protein
VNVVFLHREFAHAKAVRGCPGEGLSKRRKHARGTKAAEFRAGSESDEHGGL